MNRNDEALAAAPTLTASDAEWRNWTELWYPYDTKSERILTTRMPKDAAPPQSPDELADIAGLRDRDMALYLARSWFVIRNNMARQRREATNMPTPQAQQQRAELFNALDDYDQAE